MNWIKIKDQLPTNSAFYLVVDSNDAYSVAYYNVTTGKWGISAFYWREEDIIAYSEFEKFGR